MTTSSRAHSSAPADISRTGPVIQSQPADPDTALTIYVGVPFCNSKCHFCCFVADIETGALVNRQHLHGDYVCALVEQIEHFLPRLAADGRPIQSIYFGGGTPTILSTDQLVRILSSVQSAIRPLDDTTSVTLETTPENVANHDFTALRRAGFNRISMGIQSMQSAVLKAIGRSHGVEQVPEALRTFRAAGFDNVNVDLMFGLPEESLQDVAYNLERSLELEANHFSFYLYEPDPRTVTARLCKVAYSAEELVERFDLVQAEMARAGLEGYNSFYYTRDGRRCDVDDAYYTLSNEWVGFGASANSLLSGRMCRTVSDSAAFIANPLSLGPSTDARANPTFLFMLTMYMFYSDDGVRFDRYSRNLGLEFDEAFAVCPELESWYELALNDGRLQRDDSGVRFRDRREQAQFICEHTIRRYSPEILKTRRFAKPYDTGKGLEGAATELVTIGGRKGSEVGGADEGSDG